MENRILDPYAAAETIVEQIERKMPSPSGQGGFPRGIHYRNIAIYSG